MYEKVTLHLEDGTTFEGCSVGAKGYFAGELVFHTAFTGYQEIITDPSYTGQAIVFAAPHIGNVGVNSQDSESDDCCCEGIITRQFSTHSSHWRAEGDLQDFLIKRGKFALSDVDTRGLIQHLRNNGPLNFSLSIGGILEKANIEERYNNKPCNRSRLSRRSNDQMHIVILDFGVKKSIIDMLQLQGCSLTILQQNASLKQILADRPDGVVISNGPGDPKGLTKNILIIRELIELGIPIFGICLGHQLLALALGGDTQKMALGHHGSNHPVMDVETGKVYITSQNHCFTVDETSLPSSVVVTHRSLFDGTVAGLKSLDKPLFSFQGHPEGNPGPQEVAFLFTRFFQLMREAYAQTN